MELFILRHGDAPYQPDAAERVLSPTGRTETERVIRAREAELSEIEHIICSPVRRARETLSVVTDVLGYRGKLSFDDALRSESTLGAVTRLVNLFEDEKVLLVSHQPLVGQMLNFLVDESGLGHRMGTSCLARFEILAFSRGAGQLSWLQTP